jgi:hypothetical protein
LKASAIFYKGKPEEKDVEKEMAKLEVAHKANRDKQRQLFGGWLSSKPAAASTAPAPADAASAPATAAPAAAAPPS